MRGYVALVLAFLALGWAVYMAYKADEKQAAVDKRFVECVDHALKIDDHSLSDRYLNLCRLRKQVEEL